MKRVSACVKVGCQAVHGWTGTRESRGRGASAFFVSSLIESDDAMIPRNRRADLEGSWARLNRWIANMPTARLSQGVTMRRRMGRVESQRILDAAERGRARSGITGPSTLHLGGLDWLDLTLYGMGSDKFKEVVGDFIYKRDEMIRRKEKQSLVYIGERLCILKAAGRGFGLNHHPVQIVTQGINFAFGARDSSGPDGKGSGTMMFVDIPGEAFLVLGERGALEVVQDIVRGVGLNIDRVGVRRVDGCVDLPNVKVSEFYDEIIARRMITRGTDVADHYDPHTGELTGIVVHGEACRMTIYDKVKRVEDTAPHQMPYMIEHRWHGVKPAHATRVEMRIRPAKVKFADIRDLGDLLEGLQRIFAWATEAWFRLAEVKDRRHTERAAVHYLWLEVMASFAAWTEGCDLFLTKRVSRGANAEHLAKAALSMLAKAAAMAGLESEGRTMENLFAELMSSGDSDDIDLRQMEVRDLLATKVWEKRAERPGGLSSD